SGSKPLLADPHPPLVRLALDLGALADERVARERAPLAGTLGAEGVRKRARKAAFSRENDHQPARLGANQDALGDARAREDEARGERFLDDDRLHGVRLERDGDRDLLPALEDRGQVEPADLALEREVVVERP